MRENEVRRETSGCKDDSKARIYSQNERERGLKREEWQ